MAISHSPSNLSTLEEALPCSPFAVSPSCPWVGWKGCSSFTRRGQTMLFPVGAQCCFTSRFGVRSLELWLTPSAELCWLQAVSITAHALPPALLHLSPCALASFLFWPFAKRITPKGPCMGSSLKGGGRIAALVHGWALTRRDSRAGEGLCSLLSKGTGR